MNRLEIPLTPVSKKNSQQIITVKGRMMIIPSKVYRQYEKEAIYYLQLQWGDRPHDTPLNVAMVFYMPTHRRVDLVNLQEACLDVLVKAGIIEDDNCNIVATMDGSAVRYDKKNPRTEIIITTEADHETGSA